jgi:hypothetical protein
MDKRKLAFLLLLLLCGAALSQDIGTMVTSVNSQLSQEGSAFVKATQAGANVPGQTFNSVFEAFDPGFCGHDMFSPDPGWIEFTALAIMAVAFGVTLVWMMGQVVQSTSLIVAAKDEGIQLFYTVLRVVFIFGCLFAANSWFTIRAGSVTDPTSLYLLRSTDPANFGGQITIIDAAMAFCRSMIVEMITNYSNLVIYNMVVHTLYSSTMWFGVTWRVMYSFNLGPVLKPLIDIIGMALQFLGLGISEWMLHLVTLCLIKRWTWSLFIPVAIFLRAIPQTRGSGEALFAIVFALALVYPFMFLVTYETHKLLQNNLVDSTNALSSFVQKSGILAVAASVLVIMFLAAGVFFPFFVGSAMSIAFELIRNAVYYVVIMSLLLPFLNIFVTLTAAREIAKFFNVDVSFMSFVKII